MSASTTSRTGMSRWTKLNVVSLLVQAGVAFYRGRKRRAALLLGTAAVATRNKRLAYAIQGALVTNDVRKRLFAGS